MKIIQEKDTHLIVSAIIIIVLSVIFKDLHLPVSKQVSLNASRSHANISEAIQPVAHLLIDYGDGTQRAFEGQAIPQMSILQVIYNVSGTAGLNFKYQADPEDIIKIISLGDRFEGMDGKHWSIYLNDEKQNINSIASVYIVNGDRIEAKFE